jgi:hypothetical protein
MHDTATARNAYTVIKREVCFQLGMTLRPTARCAREAPSEPGISMRFLDLYQVVRVRSVLSSVLSTWIESETTIRTSSGAHRVGIA